MTRKSPTLLKSVCMTLLLASAVAADSLRAQYLSGPQENMVKQAVAQVLPASSASKSIANSEKSGDLLQVARTAPNRLSGNPTAAEKDALKTSQKPVANSAAQTLRNATALAPGNADLDAALNAELDAVLAAIVNDPATPLASLSAIAIHDGRVVYEGQFGQRVIRADGSGLPVNADTLYRVASISKMVTALGAMRLVETGRLSLDVDVSTYLGFRLRNPNFPETPITTRMLLSHTSSLRDDNGYSFPLAQSLQSFFSPGAAHYGNGSQWARSDLATEGSAGKAEEAGIAGIAGKASSAITAGTAGAVGTRAASFAPGRYFAYVNLNYGVLGSVMEAASGQRFDLYMKNAVLQPLGISGGFLPELFSADELANLAVLYRKQTKEVWNSQGPWVAQTDDFGGVAPPARDGLASYVLGSNASAFSPQGGLRVSARGLARLMLLMMNGGAVDGVRLLRKDSLQTLLKQAWKLDARGVGGDSSKGEFNAWGLGVQRFIDISAPHSGDRFVKGGGVTGVGHLGFAYGLQSGFIFNPDRRDGVIYLMGGVAANPDAHPGAYSSFSAWEEKALDALYRRAAAGQPKPGRAP